MTDKREIRFRVFHDGEMHYMVKGSHLYLSFFSEGIPWGLFEIGTDRRLVTGDPNAILNTPGILMQFTGLKDETGLDIYEGDILEFDLWSEGKELGVVRFSDAGFWTSQKEGEDEQILSEELHDIHARVIGNIYQNPDLL